MKNLIDRFRAWLRSRRLDEQPLPEKDPVVTSSLATPIAFWSFLLILTLLWAFYQEVASLRPWRDYQEDFAELYRQVLIDLKPQRAQELEEIRSSEGFQQLQQLLQKANQAIESELKEIEAEERLISAQLAAITNLFTTARSEIQATIYQVETAPEEDKEGLTERLEQLRAQTFAVRLASGTNGNGLREERYSYDELEELFNRLKQRQGELQGRKVEILREPGRLQRELNHYVDSRRTGLTPTQIDGLLNQLDNFQVEIRQIHNPEMGEPGNMEMGMTGLVDRCESCHVGIREPVELTAEQMGGRPEFVSHPNRELLDLHNPEVFGCTPCHNGNGVATVSITKGHGQYKHWLWPLYARANFEAGCLQCHEADRRLEMAPTLNAGKQLFYERGCWGCHAREGFDREPKELRDTHKLITDLRLKREETELEIQRTIRQADRAETNEEATRLYAKADGLTLGIGHIDSRLDLLNEQAQDALMELKIVGPNLKEIPVKLRKEWVPQWIENPHNFRPTTKMPRFRIEEDQVKAIAAFVWQSGVQGQLQAQPRGNATRGKELFLTRGCLACHSIGDEQVPRDTFAADLSRVGEKVKYDYLVRWIHDPRERTLPYCPTHERDITPEDYANAGLPFRFDAGHNRCPLGDHPLQVQNPTIMPSLRLSWEEARDIATYLMTLRQENAEYAPAPYMDDPGLFEEGEQLVSHFGCAGCHEIAGKETEGKIGTDLTKEGSKPIERLDFALLTETARHEGWYNHKGFFERKLADPAVFDEGKIKEPLERLRMPDPALSESEITQLTTFLLGSVNSKIPANFHFQPEDHRREIQEGWWLVMKYNCVACHQFVPGQSTALEQHPRFQDPDLKEQLPPSLVGQGARVDPNWLARFLKNPALSETNVHTNGVRPYLEARMPTFYLSDKEIQTLVRFFNALSEQPVPYSPPAIPELTPQELTSARELFTHPAAPCLRCHATGDPATDSTKTAPNFVLVPERLKPDWTKRWIVHPEIIRPGTNMPSGLFRWDGSRWVFALADIPSLRRYEGDHADLIVRYMFHFSPAEQRRLER